MGVKIPNKIKVTLTKADTDIATTGGLKGYFYVLNNGSALLRSSDKVETVRISVPKYANTFYFRGGSTFYGPDGKTIISAEFLFLGADNTLIDHWKQDEVLLSYSKEFTIPEGTVTIYAPHITSMDATMRFGYEELDVTDGVMNFDELQISMSRDGASAVFVSSELPTQFARKSLGYNLLITEFANRGIRAKISLKVYQRSPFAKPTYVYTPVLSAAVDFSSYKQYRNYVEVSCEDATLNQLILSNGSNDYDILVSEISTNSFQWDDMAIPQFGKMELSEAPMNIGLVLEKTLSSPSITVGTTSRLPGTIEHDVKGQNWRASVAPGAQYFFKAKETVRGVTVLTDIRATGQAIIDKQRFDQSGRTQQELLDALNLQIQLYQGSSYSPLASSRTEKVVEVSADGLNYIAKFTTVFQSRNEDIVLQQGDTLGLLLQSSTLRAAAPEGPVTSVFTAQIGPGSSFTVVFPSDYVSGSGRRIAVINPQVLLQKFLDRMADQPGRYKATINWRQDEATDYRIRLLAAESIAGYKTPYLHGNIKDFMNWMRVMGYEYEITGNEIIYRPREQFYTTEQMLDLTEAQLNDLTISPATNVLYATVKVGYEKQDYNDDYLDGLEANALFQYGTGIDALEGDMDLTSPYRADAIGIQLLYRDPETGETESDQRDNPDEDIFVVVLNKTGDDTVYTAVTLDVFDQLSDTYLKLPNALVSAPYLVQYNAPVIGISTNRITFASTTGNKDAMIADVPINSDIAITEQLFKPVLYEFEAGAGKEFPVTTGLLAGCGAVAFTWQGQTLRGFVKDIIRDVVDSEAVTWQLYAIDTPTL